MKDIYIDYTKPLLRGGNSETKKDLLLKIKELEKDGWKVTFGKWGKGENEYFEYWFEATKLEKIEEGECERCKSENIVEIIYGYPTKKTLIRAEKGEIELGGCEITEADPTRFCKSCGKKFRKRRIA